MKVYCPECRSTIAADDIALTTGWAKCRRCDEVFKLADVVPDFAPSTPPDQKPPRPYDGWTLLERDGERLIIVSPPRGWRTESWALLGFAVVWITFVSFGTAGALGSLLRHRPPGAPFHWDRLFPALFLIPFWIVGLGLAGALLWSVLGARRVYLDASILYGEMRCLTWRRTVSMDRQNVQHAREDYFWSKNNASPQMHCTVDIVHTKGVFRLPVASEAEQQWLAAEINDFLKQTPYEAPVHGDFHAPEWPHR
jgi:hypothetical protein